MKRIRRAQIIPGTKIGCGLCDTSRNGKKLEISIFHQNIVIPLFKGIIPFSQGVDQHFCQRQHSIVYR